MKVYFWLMSQSSVGQQWDECECVGEGCFMHPFRDQVFFYLVMPPFSTRGLQVYYKRGEAERDGQIFMAQFWK